MNEKHKRSKKEIDRVCHYCENASPLQDKDYMLCSRLGVVGGGHSCRHFSYDPLKRIPAPRKHIASDVELPELP